MNIIDKILIRKEFVDNPPVLLDIGASGSIHPKWKDIARYSICIAFDADDREIGYTVKESSGFKKLYIYNKIVTDKIIGKSEFYLTKSPYCSSLLQPNHESLNNWAFAELFEIEKKVILKAVALPMVLKEIGIHKIDWFKTDSQGIDLRLFDCLGDECINRVLVAEFEPGIINAYEGEDKLWRLMAYMDKHPFWMADINILGTQRICRETINAKLTALDKKMIHILLKTSPCWGEVVYFNMFPAYVMYLDKRDFLLGWIFAVIERQYGFALEIAIGGYKRFDDPIFIQMEEFVYRKIKQRYLKLPLYIGRKIVHKIFRLLGING